MSWRHSKAAGELPLKRPPTKAVLLALAHHANEYDGTCYPSIARLMLFTGLSERSVQNSLTELEQAGHIKRWIGRKRTVSVYQLTLEAAPLLTQGQPPERVQEMHPRVQDVHPIPAGGAPQQSINSQKNRTPPAKGPVPEDWWPNDEAIRQAMKELPNVDITTETKQFVEYNAARGTEFASIGAAWRSWLRRAKPGGGRPGAKRTDTGGGLDRLRELAAGEGARRPS